MYPDASQLPLGQWQSGGCPGDGKMLMQVAGLTWAWCEGNPTAFWCENTHHPRGRLLASTLGPAGNLKNECDTSHNWQFVSRFSYITIYIVTDEALLIRMRAVDSNKTGLIIITHCSVIRLLKCELGKQQILQPMFMV